MARIIFTGAVQQATGTEVASRMPAVSTTTAMQASVQKEQQQQHAQGVKQAQSLALVQIMLHASFGTLFYLREFLPLDCFDERDLMKLSKPNSYVSYANFVEGGPVASNNNINRNTHERRAQPLKIIVRGKNPKADKNMEIFDAIEKNFLEALQMTIFVDKTKSSHVLESYTFTFKYTPAATGGGGCKQKDGGDDVGKQLASVSLESTGCTADMKTVKTARHGLEMIVRRLITLSAFLPMLPNERYMELHLFYTDGSPPGYEPPGFKAAEHNDLLFAQNEMWSRETQSCGAMETGIHSVGLKISSLKWSGTDYPSSEYVPEIPADIGYSNRVRRDEDIGISEMDVAVQDLGLSTQGSSQVSTQTRQDEAFKKDLQKMIPPVTSTPDSDFIPTQRNPDCLQIATAKPQLSQVKLSQLGARNQMFSGETSLHYDQNKGHSGHINPDVVRCECGSNSENRDMLQCAFCKTRQHLTCYGFIHAQDPAIPETHACYKCLLEPQERHLVQDMRTLVLLRRALRVIIEEGYPNRVRDFAQKLNCNGQTIVQITDMLRKQGFLLATPGSKSKGFLEKGLPKFTLSTETAVKQRLRNEIFNPLAKITHHYNLPDNQNRRVGQRARSVELSSGVSSDVLSIEEIPPGSPGYEERRRKSKIGGTTNATGKVPTPEVNEIRSAWKALGSSLDSVKPVQPSGDSQTETQTQTQTQAQAQKRKPNRSIMGDESGFGFGSASDRGDRHAWQGFTRRQKQTRTAEWVDDFDDDDDDGEGIMASGSDGENGTATNRRKRVRLSKLGSPISIFEPSSESGMGSGSEGDGGSGSRSASGSV
ncbi:meiosis specific protein Hop1 [Blastomyces dermatitidis ER-3]|uniref:Meiosis specific protein Hop1 n=2 Tax=Ajellomyces dermatitidis (strain ER-3 / ATCC MYA-2586) TaxID=559297 RepID=A0ABX2W061_AJEDR|nr:meiosis specific protein Hop1 [Blastomyces dermatitidis ER-3]OAT02764.1 meiosis specific protein Hop1 [Blastomyces dermatitidis ER-3]